MSKVSKEPRRRHTKTRRERKRIYDKGKRHRKQKKKQLLVEAEIQKIKESNLVKNFSSEEIPDEVYLYLALGSQFCPTSTPRLHDYTFDTKEFCRKLAWSAHHENERKEGENVDEIDLAALFENDDETGSWKFVPQKLKLKSQPSLITTTTY